MITDAFTCKHRQVPGRVGADTGTGQAPALVPAWQRHRMAIDGSFRIGLHPLTLTNIAR